MQLGEWQGQYLVGNRESRGRLWRVRKEDSESFLLFQFLEITSINTKMIFYKSRLVNIITNFIDISRNNNFVQDLQQAMVGLLVCLFPLFYFHYRLIYQPRQSLAYLSLDLPNFQSQLIFQVLVLPLYFCSSCFCWRSLLAHC